MENPSLYPDGSTRCSRCLDIVRQVEQSESSYWQNAKDALSTSTHRDYEPSSSCSTCRKHLQCWQYGSLGSHLWEAHDNPKVMVTMSGDCCYICLLCLQLKCRNGFQSNSAQLFKTDVQMLNVTYRTEGAHPGDIQFFSASVDGLVDIAYYLPHG